MKQRLKVTTEMQNNHKQIHKLATKRQKISQRDEK